MLSDGQCPSSRADARDLKKISPFGRNDISLLCALAQPSDLGLIRPLAEPLREIFRNRPVRIAHPTKSFVLFVSFVVNTYSLALRLVSTADLTRVAKLMSGFTLSVVPWAT